jgi:hypothetical protein
VSIPYPFLRSADPGRFNCLSTKPDTVQFLATGGTIITSTDAITVHLDRRTHSPILRQADHPNTTIPWWGNRTLRFEYR